MNDYIVTKDVFQWKTGDVIQISALDLPVWQSKYGAETFKLVPVETKGK